MHGGPDLVADGMADFVVNFTQGVSSETCQQPASLLIVGTYRDDRLKESDVLMEGIDFIKSTGKANVTKLTVREFSRQDVTELVSSRLCMPWRYVRDLSALVYSKAAKGNPFHVIQVREQYQYSLPIAAIYRTHLFDTLLGTVSQGDS